MTRVGGAELSLSDYGVAPIVLLLLLVLATRLDSSSSIY